jgi:pyruvate-ferredoxin/flavodoxin oxidoreductase
MGARINTIMQVCFFAISGVLPRDEAIQKIKDAIQKTYGAKGEEVVRKNFMAVDQTLANLHEATLPGKVTSTLELPPVVSEKRSGVRPARSPRRSSPAAATTPGQRLPVRRHLPHRTSQWEKRNIALEIPVWDEDVCIQCGKCALVCPHAAIRTKIYDPSHLETAPATFKSVDFKSKDLEGLKLTVQTAPEDCTGCGSASRSAPRRTRASRA